MLVFREQYELKKLSIFLLIFFMCTERIGSTKTVTEVTSVTGKGCSFKTYEGGDSTPHLTFTNEGNASGVPCSFPFIMDGNVVTDCLPYENYEWCSTKPTYASEKHDNRWGKCIKNSVPTVEGNGERRPCYFPFIYNGVEHHTCLPRDDYTWCATTQNFDRQQKWGKCVHNKGPSTIGGNAQGAPCKFPFTFEGKQHLTCIDHGSSYKWCATTDNFDQDQLWGKCLEQDDVERLPTVHAAIPSSAVLVAFGSTVDGVVQNLPTAAAGLIETANLLQLSKSFGALTQCLGLLGAGFGVINAFVAVSPEDVVENVNKAFDMLIHEMNDRMDQILNYVDKEIRELHRRIVESQYKVDKEILTQMVLLGTKEEVEQALRYHVIAMFAHRYVYMKVDQPVVHPEIPLKPKDVKTLEALLPVLKQHVDLHLLATAALINTTSKEGDEEAVKKSRVWRRLFINYVDIYSAYIEWAYGQILARRVTDHKFSGDKSYSCDEPEGSAHNEQLYYPSFLRGISKRVCHFKCTSMERDLSCSVTVSLRCLVWACVAQYTMPQIESKTKESVNNICKTYLEKLERQLKNFWNREVLDYIPVWKKAADLQREELEKINSQDTKKERPSDEDTDEYEFRNEIADTDSELEEEIRELEMKMRDSLRQNMTMVEYSKQALRNSKSIASAQAKRKRRERKRKL